MQDPEVLCATVQPLSEREGAKHQEYVLVYAYCLTREKAIFVLKDRPESQAGRINLPGGKVEPGETARQAAVREFREECGIDVSGCDLKLMGHIKGYWGTIACFMVDLEDGCEIKPSPEETEKFFWGFPYEVIHRPECMPNLKVTIPLLEMGVGRWSITDNNPSLDHRPYINEIALEN